MRILHVIHDHPDHPTIGGGGAVRVHEIATRLANRGHQVHIVSGWFEGCKDTGPGGDGCRVTFLGRHRRPACKAIEYAFAAWRQLPSLAREADVVIEDFSPYAPVGAFRLQRRGTPVLLQIQNFTGAEFLTRHGPAGLPLRVIERWYPGLFHHHVLVGEHLLTRFHAKKNSWVVPMGFSAAPAAVSADGPRDYIAFLGRLDFHQKGLDILLAALQGTDLPVWFAGTGRETGRLKEDLAGLPSCRYLGRLDGQAKWDFLRGARFLVIPSRFEGQPVVSIESAAMKTPILASGIPELDFIAHEGIGRQFSPLQPVALREALLAMWEDQEALAACGREAIRFAANRTWDHIAIDFEKTLENVIANP
ncbi:MAG: glycosyltransferase family 4 protein [Chthoniobacterales bacterium]